MLFRSNSFVKVRNERYVTRNRIGFKVPLRIAVIPTVESNGVAVFRFGRFFGGCGNFRTVIIFNSRSLADNYVESLNGFRKRNGNVFGFDFVVFPRVIIRGVRLVSRISQCSVRSGKSRLAEFVAGFVYKRRSITLIPSAVPLSESNVFGSSLNNARTCIPTSVRGKLATRLDGYFRSGNESGRLKRKRIVCVKIDIRIACIFIPLTADCNRNRNRRRLRISVLCALERDGR